MTIRQEDIIESLCALQNEAQREILMRFFKTGPGQYGEGDRFLGIKVPDTRLVAKEARDLSLEETEAFLHNPWHEIRLCGFLILTYQMEKLSKKKILNDPETIKKRDSIVKTYLRNADFANNWDLVDLSAPKIIGTWLLLPSEIRDKRKVMDELAESNVLWRQRIAMVSTWKTTQQGDFSYAMHYAERLLYHPHDLMHKAVGWMLREVGKRGGKELLDDFLEKYADRMPRTTLRYAIELLPEQEKRHWMNCER